MKKGLLALALAPFALFAQVTLQPTFVTQNDTVTVVFDATQGTGGLVGESQVYIHTGVITNLSSSPTDWRHVQGNWGVADAKVAMTNQGNDIHTIKFHIATFYGIPAGETASAIACVFRNTDGSKEGKGAGGSDIFVPIYPPGFHATFVQPSATTVAYSTADSLYVFAQASSASNLELTWDGVSIAQATGATELDYGLNLSNTNPGNYQLIFAATDGANVAADTLNLAVYGPTITAPLPSFAGEDGITFLGDTAVYLQLYAPGKPYAFLINPDNNWSVNPNYQMYRSPDGNRFWFVWSGLDPDVYHTFQYFVDGIRIADPYSEMVLDPWNDKYIQDSTFADLPDYPLGTQEPVTAFMIHAEEYQWDQSFVYQKPDKDQLIVYELLIRDFTASHSYAGTLAKLDYLDSLGVNAIELMPIMEFEGNESWGYNPSFFFAPDKYYGPKNEFKRFVDSCHRRGIAVILDIAMNHAFGQCPLVRLYFDGSNPAANSPWFNVTPKHDFNVGYDFNHLSPATVYFASRVFKHWIREYKIDGYRMDLSKGYTQNNTLGNIGAMGQYDASRIEILTGYADSMRTIDPSTFVILEHFAENTEEKELSNRGFMLWGNSNHDYTESAMGYTSSFNSVYAPARGWADFNLMSYMESHDEERLMYQITNYGASSADYSTKPQDTALQRVALANNFFYTIPGPKMLWQFGEVGYDYSINYCPDGTINNNCRLANKPIRWDYYTDPKRRALYNQVAELTQLRRKYPVFTTDRTANLLVNGAGIKSIRMADNDHKVVVVGNFGTVVRFAQPNFQVTGMWYEFYSGDSLMVNSTDTNIRMMPGEYKLYSTVKMRPDRVDVNPIDSLWAEDFAVYPTVSTNQFGFYYNSVGNVYASLYIYNTFGQVVWKQTYQPESGAEVIEWKGVNEFGTPVVPGIYFFRFEYGGKVNEGRIMKM